MQGEYEKILAANKAKRKAMRPCLEKYCPSLYGYLVWGGGIHHIKQTIKILAAIIVLIFTVYLIRNF